MSSSLSSPATCTLDDAAVAPSPAAAATAASVAASATVALSVSPPERGTAVVTYRGEVLKRFLAGHSAAEVILAFESSSFGPIIGVRDARNITRIANDVLAAGL